MEVKNIVSHPIAILQNYSYATFRNDTTRNLLSAPLQLGGIRGLNSPAALS
jgi:hypothetical protein